MPLLVRNWLVLPFKQKIYKYVLGFCLGKTKDQEKLHELDEKVDKVIQKMEGFVDCDDEVKNDLEKDMEEVKKKRKRRIVIG